MIYNREKISALPSGKINKYKYLTGEEMLSPDQRRVIEQASLHILLQKKILKKKKKIKGQGEKQIKAIEKHGKQLIKSSFEKDSLELLEQK